MRQHQPNKITLYLILIVLILSGITINLGQAQAQPVFRIGVLDSENGPISSGARLAIQEINDAGGVVGADGTAFRLELVIQSTANNRPFTDAVTTIQQASVIAVLGPTTTEEVLANLSVLQSLNVPVLTPALGDTIIASDSLGRLFRTRAAQALQGRALVDYLINDLELSRISTVQMDLTSTAAVVGFSTAAAGLGVTPQAILYDSGMNISQLANNVISQNPEIAVAYGPPDTTAQLYTALRVAGWQGLFAYNQIDASAFRDSVPFNTLEGILSTTTWPYAATDTIGNNFLNAFVRSAGYVPGSIEAASYDAIYLLSEAIGLPGDLQTNLAQLNNVQGVQGTLSPAQLTRGETSNNVAVVQIGPLGGAQIRARYAGNQRISGAETGSINVIPQLPTATPTLEGVIMTVKSAVQNVRTGPGMEYDILGKIRKDEQAKIIGATLDFSWVVIDYRGQNGWLATYLLDVTGDRASVPVIAAPPTPTPRPPTQTPTPSPTADIVVVAASPSVITKDKPFNITVTIANTGTVAAGPFAVATNFQPQNVYSGVNLSGLGAGQQTNITLSGEMGGATGLYEIVIVADLNNEVNEGPQGEANNGDFNFKYRLDGKVINSGTLTLNPGGMLSLEGAGTADVQWNATGTSLDFPSPPSGSGMYIIGGVNNMNDIHRGLIDRNMANTYNLNVALLPNTYIGIITAEGHKGVIHVDNVVSGGPITLTYRVYENS